MIHANEPVPEATIARLPGYIRALDRLMMRAVATTSSSALAKEAGCQPAQLRRDLSYFGNLGTRGVGYDVARLRQALGELVGSDTIWPIIIVGVGNLGSALSRQFERPPFRVVALVDSNPDLVGAYRQGVEIWPQTQLAQAIAQTQPVIGVIAVPPVAAQEVCDSLVSNGIHTLLNFSPTVLSVPETSYVRTVDLSQELHILAYHEQQRSRDSAPKKPKRRGWRSKSSSI